tara:strand:- start:862 stop:1032 length:171 start_codon:yes stop_codon:yes gene_type:complete
MNDELHQIIDKRLSEITESLDEMSSSLEKSGLILKDILKDIHHTLHGMEISLDNID